MTFFFLAETGTTDPNANSYASVEFADDYISTNAFAASAWNALEAVDKERALIRTSRYFDNVIQWAGSRVDDTSGLRWPRYGVFNSDGYEYPSDAIPEVLQEATAEFAAILASGDDWTSQPSTHGMKGIQVDVIGLEFDTEITRGSLPDYIMQMLSGLGVVTSSKRPQFKPVIRN